jgi:hypothetical protein
MADLEYRTKLIEIADRVARNDRTDINNDIQPVSISAGSGRSTGT